MKTVSRDDLEVVQTIWSDHFKDALPPSQFATWLRIYPVDVIADGIAAGQRKAIQMNGKKRFTLNDVIHYASAVMRNIKADRELDAEHG